LSANTASSALSISEDTDHNQTLPGAKSQSDNEGDTDTAPGGKPEGASPPEATNPQEATNLQEGINPQVGNILHDGTTP
jgi:hypothetical protein